MNEVTPGNKVFIKYLNKSDSADTNLKIGDIGTVVEKIGITTVKVDFARNISLVDKYARSYDYLGLYQIKKLED